MDVGVVWISSGQAYWPKGHVINYCCRQNIRLWRPLLAEPMLSRRGRFRIDQGFIALSLVLQRSCSALSVPFFRFLLHLQSLSPGPMSVSLFLSRFSLNVKFMILLNIENVRYLHSTINMYVLCAFMFYYLGVTLFRMTPGHQRNMFWGGCFLCCCFFGKHMGCRSFLCLAFPNNSLYYG